MARIELQQSVFDLLKNLRGLEPLKRLFWSELNYERVNQPLSRHGWSDTATSALTEDPVLFAGGGESNDFHVIYGRLASDRLLLGQERPVVSRLIHDHPYVLFIFSNAAQDRWHFINIKYDEEIIKRRLFRRITIGPEERLRTASERVSLLDLTELSDLSPLVIQERHDEAFDVEAVQKDFFRVFAELYHKVADDISKVHGLEKESGKLAQLLLNRMLFLYFIQKKGWLDQKLDYLYSRFQDCWKKDPRGNSYYSGILYPLFICLSNSAMKIDTVGAVPFLNGGLFEEAGKQTQAERLEQARLQIKNTTFKAIFDDLLERFNFTVTEDTPIDIEVAIDPEMLGKIFESLILQLEKDPNKDLRKLTGSYYTPRPIVHFMCQEALKEYLTTQLIGNDGVKAEVAREKMDKFMSLPPADHLDDEQVKTLVELLMEAEAKMLRQAILDCRICDPAVGSGAFPVGMLHEMVSAIARLDLRLHGKNILLKRNYDYDLKKQIIEFCLYGVDIQDQAVRLCELRLWLSLIVDYQIDQNRPFDKAIHEIPSLPNLFYRVMRGDSLLERLFGHFVQLDQMAKDAKTKQLIESIQADKQSYFREGDTTEKRRLELKILAKQADLAERLIEAKRAAVKGYSTGMFGEEAMAKKERKAKIEYEGQMKELDDLKRKVSEAKGELERITRQKNLLVRGDLDTLRRKFFQTGDASTFMWRVDFAEVFRDKEGFDIVIGNPPYVDSEHMVKSNPEERNMLNKMYLTAKGNWDLYIPFWELSINCVHNKGIVALISPNKWLSIGYGESLRKFAKPFLHKLIDYSSFRVFESVGVFPVVVLMNRGIHNLVNIKHFGDGHVLSYDQTLTPETINNFANWGVFLSKHLDLITELVNGSDKLSDFCSVEEAFTVSEAYRLSEYLVEQKGSKGDVFKFVNTGTIDPYVSLWGQKATTYLKTKYHMPVVDKKMFKKHFEKRFIQTSCPKIVISGIRHFEAFLDKDGEWIAGKSTVILRNFNVITPPELLLGILNSRLISFFLKECYGSLGMDGGINFSPSNVSEIPIPRLTKREEKILDAVVDTVNQLISVKRSDPFIDASSLIDGIDDLIYKLYGLSSAQIAIVEGQTDAKT